MDSRLLSLFLKVSSVVHPRFYTAFDGLRKSLAKASIKISFRTYVGMMMFSSLVSGIATFSVAYFLMPVFGILQLTYSLAFSGLIGVLAAVSTLGSYFIYPKFKAYSRANKIDSNLATIANFMSVLASSGMPPENIFRSLGRVSEEFSVREEASSIIRDVEFMGSDLHSSLRRASENSPSKIFANMLDGIITTSHMGGDLASYLRDQADKFKKVKVTKMKSFVESVGIIAEVYITFMVAAPLMLIVMLSVMAFLGGTTNLGMTDPRVMLNLLTFVITPVGVTMMILAVDSIAPQR